MRLSTLIHKLLFPSTEKLLTEMSLERNRLYIEIDEMTAYNVTLNARIQNMEKQIEAGNQTVKELTGLNNLSAGQAEEWRRSYNNLLSSISNRDTSIPGIINPGNMAAGYFGLEPNLSTVQPELFDYDDE